MVIDSAYEAYEESCTECDENLEDLLWQLKTNRENYNMYQNLEKELQGWYKEGYIRKSEYLSAKTNKEKYFERIKRATEKLEEKGFKVYSLTDDDVLFYNGESVEIL